MPIKERRFLGWVPRMSSAQVWEALGNKLVAAPIAAMILHLSVGDTWNHINNVEKRLGVAVPVVFLVVSRCFYLVSFLM